MSDLNEYKRVILTAPGSKSVSHRLLICAALAEGTSRIKNLLDSEDIHCTADCLHRLGAGMSGSNGEMRVTGVAGRISNPWNEPITLDVRESGTTCRLLAGVVSAGHGDFLLRGRGRMHERPLLDLARAVEGQGTEFDWLEKDGCPPVRISSRGLAGGDITVNMDKSSQFLSGLLLAAPLAACETRVRVSGTRAVSWPYVGLTLQAMHNFGAKVEIYEEQKPLAGGKKLEKITPGETSFHVSPGQYRAKEVFAEGDYSSASYLLAAGALGRTAVEVRGLDPDSLQGDRVIVDILRKMGACVEDGDDCFLSRPSALRGTDIDMGNCPDLVPTVAVAACTAEGETRITNVGHLRLKESDRLAALEQELGKAGFKIKAGENDLSIKGDPVPGRDIELATHADHRMAMSLSLLELTGFKVSLDNPDCVAKSYPGFWEGLDQIKKANGI